MLAFQEFMLLAVGPLAAGPVQALYMKAGGRYDLGVSFSLAAGFILGIYLFPGERRETLGYQVPIAVVCLVAATTVFRVYIIARFSAMRFTIVSLAQMWAVVALLQYLLLSLGQPSGLYIGSVTDAWVPIVSASLISICSLYVIGRWCLWTKLRALTENREMFENLVESPLLISLKLEGLAIGVYILCGLLLRLARENLAAADFGREAIWIILAGALTPLIGVYRTRKALLFPLLIMPAFGCVAARLLIRSVAPPAFADAIAYATLAFVMICVMQLTSKGQAFERT